jgi:hypothetical protein
MKLVCFLLALGLIMFVSGYAGQQSVQPTRATPVLATATLIPPVTTTPAPTTPVAPIACRLRGPLPDPICTPGLRDPRVTQENIATTICVPGYSATVRPPTGYTTPLERELMRRYGLLGVAAQYELDHLISLELGGDPWDLRNLFPEPYEPRPGAREKDAIENRLHADVCAGRITLAEAQRRIATDWTTAR